MPILKKSRSLRKGFKLIEPKEPELYREQFPYEEVPKILFDGIMVPNSIPGDFWITDTTFRDGQQARAPYTVEQIVVLYEMLHRLGGPNHVIRQCEFFLYSDRDRQAIEGCRGKGFKYPEITGWIRANKDDFKLVKDIGLKETGILTSVSDYHIFIKLKKTRKKAMEEYLDIVKDALDKGIIPRCHFEDITRADIYGFCLPFGEQLLKLAGDSGMPVKIRLCDTMGFGITYPGAVLPRSVPRLVNAFHNELGYPSEWLEWHGHNDFHKVHINGTTAWLHGISALNTSLLGYGERTGNSPLEGAIIEYIGLKGNANGIDLSVITEIADYYKNVVRAEVPRNFPFVGNEFNTTSAGIHADGLLKSQEIYNIFNTEKLLNRPLKITVTDKSGIAGIAQWLNDFSRSKSGVEANPISKRHPGVKRIHFWVSEQYSSGRTTGISSEEMIAQAKHHLPSLFESDFKRVLDAASEKAKKLAERISHSPEVKSMKGKVLEPYLDEVLKEEGSIQLLAITDPEGFRVSQVHTQRGEKGQFRNLMNKDFKETDWFLEVIKTGKPYFSDLFFSRYTNQLIMTIAHPIFDENDTIRAVMDIDFKFEELVKLLSNVPDDILEG